MYIRSHHSFLASDITRGWSYYLLFKKDIFLRHNLLLHFITDRIQCMVDVWFQTSSVFGWGTANPQPAHRNTEREIIFQKRRTLSNGWLYGHRFSAFSWICLRTNVIQHRKEWLRSDSQGEISSGKGVKKRRTDENVNVGIAKLVKYNEQLIFAVILNSRISHMNYLHKWY